MKKTNNEIKTKELNFSKKCNIFSKLPTVIKVNQMRSLDLDFRLKIRIFDLEGFESKNF